MPTSSRSSVVGTFTRGDNVTTDQFIALAEQISGQDLDALFATWLFTPGKPVLAALSRAAAREPAEGRFSVLLRERSMLRR